MLINSLEDELNDFQNYKVPPHFFGLGIQHIDYVSVDGKGFTENIDDVDFKINIQVKDDKSRMKDVSFKVIFKLYRLKTCCK